MRFSEKGIVIHCSSSARCWIWALAATAASRLSLNTSVFGFKSAVGVPACVSQAWLEFSSRGYRCWTGLSSMPFAVLSWTAWMILSFARCVLFTIAGGQLLQFLLSVFIITTYATFGWRLAALCVRLCHSLQLAKPFHSLDKGASIVRVDNTWSATVSDEAHKTGNETACL